MTEPLSRDDVIEWLNKLGSDRDEDVLEAARQVHARIAASGKTWEVLLVSDGGDADADDDIDDDEIDDDIDEDKIDDYDTDDEDDADDTDDTDNTDNTDDDYTDDEGDDSDEGETTRPAAKLGSKHADSIALIDELLAKSKISTDMREELEGYKTDIAAGEFAARDRRYLGAVHKRLSKRR